MVWSGYSFFLSGLQGIYLMKVYAATQLIETLSH